MKHKNNEINSITPSPVFKLFFVFIFLFLFPEHAYSQHSDEKRIDSLLQLADYFLDRNYSQSLSYSIKAAKIAETEKNSIKKAWSYFYMAKSLIALKNYKKCLHYIDKSLHEEAVHDDVILLALNHLLKSSLYDRLGIQKETLTVTRNVLQLLEDKTSLEALLIKAKTYYYLSLDEDYATSDKNAAICRSLLNQISEKDYLGAKRIYLFKSYFYNARGEIFMERKKLDSAQYYLEKAYRYSFKENFIPKSTFLESLGTLYLKKGNRAKALELYLKTMHEIDRYDKNSFAKNGPGLLKNIYSIYDSMGDKKNYNFYYHRYRIAKEQFTHHLNTEVLMTADTVLETKILEHQNKIQEQTKILVVVIILAMLVLGGIFYYHFKARQKKDLLITHRETTLLETEQKATALSLKVDDALNKVIDAAKNNLQEFWPMFQKLYPDFSGKILSVNPDIKTSELVLCAYAFLGFTTKDIAVYTFKAVQTVKNNKHNLRKRLQIPPKQDLNVWLRNFYQN